MRSAIICLFVIFGFIAKAQFTILPQLGFENSCTSIEFNKISSFSPAGAKLSPQAGIRLDYKFRQLHGPFIGIATSRSIVKFNFSDPATAMNDYTVSRSNTQVRLEGGYEFSTKPIYFKKSGSTNRPARAHCQKNTGGSGCGNSIMRSSCRSKTNRTTAAKSHEKGPWVRILPSLGVAYIPFTPTSEIFIESRAAQTNYVYNAGNWNTALISGVGVEFGNNAQRKFLISINYLKGLGNLGTKSINTISGNKLTNTSLESDASSWNLRIGIPISISKRKPAVKQQVIEKNYKEGRKCGQYKMRCHRVI